MDTDRFLQDLDTLRKIGAYKTGVHRPTFSADDMASRHWLVREMEAAGLDATIDGIGNVFGRHRGVGPHVLCGSHLETQNHAGWLDGVLGVAAALALARAGLPVDVCAYCDEEGHFGNFLGSRSIVGELTDADIDAARSRNDGSPLRDALRAAGLAGLPRLQLEEGRYKGAFELHIEQGTQLENSGQRIGVVTGIVAIHKWLIVVEGQQDHTGGTTMMERKDAGLSAVRLLAALDIEFPRICGERSVWTTGRIVLHPNLAQIIPGRAELYFSYRDLAPDIMTRMEECLQAVIRESNRRERCPAMLQRIGQFPPRTVRSGDAGTRWPALRNPCAPMHGRACRAARSTTARSSRASCPSQCCSCRRSAASAIIGRKIPSGRTWCSGCRSWRTA